ncbi:MAG: hypothetical protein ACE5KJ_02720 [Candidatus Zixiibacteriota bacterium]
MMVLTRRVAPVSIFIALAVAAGLALIEIPNVELMSTIVFLSGFFLGFWHGALVGGVSMSLFSTFNPLGVPVFPVLLAQVGIMSFIGFAGGVLRSSGIKVSGPISMGWLALIGFSLTLVYDIGTNLGFAVAFGLISKLPEIVVAGLIFSAVHLVANTIFFAFLIPPVVRVVGKVRTAHTNEMQDSFKM